jgi:hypothetical protein
MIEITGGERGKVVIGSAKPFRVEATLTVASVLLESVPRLSLQRETLKAIPLRV